MTPPNTALADMQMLLDINDLARMIKRSPKTIASEVTKNPEKLPPRLKLPGSRRVLWRRADVQKWLAEHTEGA